MVAMMSRAGESHSGIGFESQVSRERERKSKGVRKRKRGGDRERVGKREREVLREVERERERERERKRMGKRMGKSVEGGHGHRERVVVDRHVERRMVG